MLRRIHDPDRGANMVEYAAVILLVAAIATMVADAGIHLRITGMIERSIASIAGEEPTTPQDSLDPVADGADDAFNDGLTQDQDSGLTGTPRYEYIRDDGDTPSDDSGITLAPGDELSESQDPIWDITPDSPGWQRFVDAFGTSVAGEFIGIFEGIFALITDFPGTIAGMWEAVLEDPWGLILSDELRDAWELGDFAAVFGHDAWDFGSLAIPLLGLALKALQILSKAPDANGPSQSPGNNDPDGEGSGQNGEDGEEDGSSEENTDRENADCGTGNSFVPGTPVLLANGSTLPIEDVSVGVEVLAFDPLTGKEGPREVTDTITGDGQKTLVTLTIASGDGATDTITATDEHPFWVPDKAEWVDAIDLQPGTWLRTSAGTWAQVTAIDTRSADDQRVHNLTVGDLHTFFVTAGSISTLTHNVECVGPIPYNSDELSSAEFEHRERLGLGFGRNVAAVRIQDTNEIITATSDGSGRPEGHSEAILLAELRDRGIDPYEDVTHLYSERQPCPDCGEGLGAEWSPNLVVTWAVPWGENSTLNRASNTRLTQMISDARND